MKKNSLTVEIDLEPVLRNYQVDIESICKLVEKNADGEVLVLPCIKYCEKYGYEVIAWDRQYGIRARTYLTKKRGRRRACMGGGTE